MKNMFFKYFQKYGLDHNEVNGMKMQGIIWQCSVATHSARTSSESSTHLKIVELNETIYTMHYH